MIYIIGDSHVSVFSGVDYSKKGLMHMQPEFGLINVNIFEQEIPYFSAIKVGSHTAFNSFNKLHKIEAAIESYNIGKGDYIFICFGQIDVQYHLIPNMVKNENSIEETIDICIESYFKTISYLKINYPNINIGVYGPPATSIGCGPNPKISKEQSIKYNSITLIFNHKLRLKCDENDIMFKQIADKLLLPDGSTDNKYVIDDIHLSQNAMPFLLKEFSDIINE
jgi:hypothetical protein